MPYYCCSLELLESFHMDFFMNDTTAHIGTSGTPKNSLKICSSNKLTRMDLCDFKWFSQSLFFFFFFKRNLDFVLARFCLSKNRLKYLQSLYLHYCFAQASLNFAWEILWTWIFSKLIRVEIKVILDFVAWNMPT